MVSPTRAVALLLAAALIGPQWAASPADASPTPPRAPTAAAAPATVSAELHGLPTAYRAAGTEGPAGAVTTVSAPTAAPIPFAMIGLELPEHAEAQVRTSADGRTWDEWEPAPHLEVDDGPDLMAPEGDADLRRHTEPVWVGPARWLQVSLEGAHPEEVDVTFIDPLGLGADETVTVASATQPPSTPAGADPATAPPAIVPRARWGADEAATRTAPSASSLRYAVVHHTAGGNAYRPADAAAVVRGIFRYHTATLGWSDIGYNFLVDRFGTVYEGRRGSLDRPVIGAHSQGFNTGSLGIAVLGEFSDVPPPPAALDAVAGVLAWKLSAHGIDPTGTTLVTSAGSNKVPAGTTLRLATIIGHRDVGLSACPGLAFHRRLPELRALVAARMVTGVQVGAPAHPPSDGYWMLDRSGAVHAFGRAPHCGDLAVGGGHGEDIEPFPDGEGYWLLDGRSSQVRAVSCQTSVLARDYEPGHDFGAQLAAGERAVSMSTVPDGTGYWVFTDRGRALAFGSATSFGDLTGTVLNGTVLDSVATPSGRGYWMVASDGGIFAFGDAAFAGSMGGTRLNAPVISMAPDADGRGYWLVASDGGIFAFDAPFYGAMGATRLNQPVTGMVASTGGSGYLMVAADGGAFTFGDVAFHGSLGDRPPSAPVTAIAPRP